MAPVVWEPRKQSERLRIHTCVAAQHGQMQHQVVADAFRLLDDPEAHAAMARPVNPYGDGHAAEWIVEALTEWSGDEG